MLTAYENSSDQQLEEFVQNHIPLVKKIALYIKRKLPSHIELDDLLQAGLIGLLEAKNNYNPDMGASFETYASIRIRGSIIDSLRDNSSFGRDTLKNMRMISEAISRVEQRNQRPATIDEIVNELGITHEEHFKISQDINLLFISSLSNEKMENEIEDDTGNPEKLLMRDKMKDKLKHLLTLLPEREQLVLSLYYVDELTFKQIGEVLDLTEARICQLHSQAIARLRGKFKND